SLSLLRDTSRIVPPALPSSSAADLPIPEDPPVIRMTLSLTESSSDPASSPPVTGIREPNALSVRIPSPAMEERLGATRGDRTTDDRDLIAMAPKPLGGLPSAVHANICSL